MLPRTNPPPHAAADQVTQLDSCDPLRNFELIVPQRIFEYPILLKATFAIAARHLSRTADYDPLASNRYHSECLAHLIPMIHHASGGLSDENLFAATIVSFGVQAVNPLATSCL